MTPIRVLVVEDSLTVRRRLCEVLDADPDIQVVGEAQDGSQAIELCAALRPDAISLDMMLPVMSGLAATEYIMAHFPTPILIVSSSTNRGELYKTYDALAAGALEVMEKPLGDDSDVAWERKLVSSLKLIARIKVITHPRGRLVSRNGPRPSLAGAVAVPPPAARFQPCQLVALGASTGGPGAILRVLQRLPASFQLPVLVVLHIGQSFSGALADWLSDQSGHRVRYAQDGQRLGPGVWLAPPDRHLLVRGCTLRLSDEPARHSCRPSVDALFESVAREYGSTATACLLTGMGCDGARGLLEIHEAGGLTIAQDEASCVVYGMPREAVALGAARRILPLQDIGPLLAGLTAGIDVRHHS